MTTVEIVFAILWIIALIFSVVSLATPNTRLRDWAFGFALGALLVLGLGGHVLH